MILRNQRSVVYESRSNKEQNYSSLERNKELNRNEIKSVPIRAPIKAPINQTSDENEKSFQSKDKNSQNEKNSYKLDSVKRISKIFERNSSKKEFDIPKIDDKVDEKEVHIKKWETYSSPVFQEKVKTYQSLVKNTDDQNRKQPHSQTILTDLSEGKTPSPEIILTHSKPKLIPSVEINEKHDANRINENLLIKMEEETKMMNTKVDDKSESKDITNFSIHSKEQEKNSEKTNNLGTSNEFKDKLKTYQTLLQNSEQQKQKEFKKKNSEISITDNLPHKTIENLEVTSSVLQPKQLSLTEIDEGIIKAASIDDKEKQTSANQEKSKSASASNDLPEIEKVDNSNNIASVALNSSKHQDNITKSDAKNSYDFKEKLKAYQMLVQTSKEKTKEVTKKSNKITLNNNLTDEKILSSKVEEFSSEKKEKTKVRNDEESLKEKTKVKSEENPLKQEAKITSVISDLQTTEYVVASNNTSTSLQNKHTENNANINNGITLSHKENYAASKNMFPYDNNLQKDKPLFESISSSVKSIVSQYQTSIQNNIGGTGKEKNKPVLNKQASKPKILVIKIHEDVFKPVEIELVEEKINPLDKPVGIDDIRSKPQENLEKSNNTPPPPPPQPMNVRIKKEVKFLKERNDTVEKLLPESGKPKTVNKLEDENKDEKIIHKQEPETATTEMEDEDHPTSSIKNIIKKAKLEAEKQEQSFKENKKSIKKAPVIINNKSTEENKVDLNQELKKTFKARTFNNEVVSSDNFEEETIIDNLKDHKNDPKSIKVFKYKIGQKSEEEIITDWTPVNEVIVKTHKEIEIQKKENNPNSLYMSDDSDLEEITYKNTKMNAKTTTELKSILKGGKSPPSPMKRSSQKAETSVNGYSADNSEGSGDNNKKSTLNLEKFIAKHLEKQMGNGNTVEIPKPAKRGATRMEPINKPTTSKYLNENKTKIPNGTIVNSKSEHDFPEPDYD